MPDDLTNNNNNTIHSLSANNLKKHFVMVNLNNFSNYSTMLQTFIHHQPSHQNQSKHQQSITLTPILVNNINIVSNNLNNNKSNNNNQSTTTQSDYSFPQPISIADIINWPDSNGLSLLSLVCSSSSHHTQ
jgi:hypothetical protein